MWAFHSYLTHTNLILLPIAFALKILTQEDLSRQKKALNLGIFIGALLVSLSPWSMWNWRTVGQWFHSPSLYYLLEQLKIASITLDQDRVVWVVTPSPVRDILARYSVLFAKSAWAGARQYIEMVTPIGAFFLTLALASPLLARTTLGAKGLARHWWMNFLSPISFTY